MIFSANGGSLSLLVLYVRSQYLGSQYLNSQYVSSQYVSSQDISSQDISRQGGRSQDISCQGQDISLVAIYFPQSKATYAGVLVFHLFRNVRYNDFGSKVEYLHTTYD